jgi:hypothetical protein
MEPKHTFLTTTYITEWKVESTKLWFVSLCVMSSLCKYKKLDINIWTWISSFQLLDYVLPLEYENIHIANVKNKVLGMTLGSHPKKNWKLSLM